MSTMSPVHDDKEQGLFDGLAMSTPNHSTVEANGEEEDTPKVTNTKVIDVSKAGALEMEDESSELPASTSTNGSKEAAADREKEKVNASGPEPTTPTNSNRATVSLAPDRSSSVLAGGSRVGGMRVHVDTPIPNADKCLRILRKFHYKTRAKIAESYGGTKSAGLMRFFRSSAKDDPTFVPYRQLVSVLLEGDEEDEDDGSMTDTDEENSEHNTHTAATDESDFVVDSILGASGDSMAKARAAVAAFCDMLSVWGHASSRYFELQDTKAQQSFSELLVTGIDSAAELVSHGCLDGVLICNLASANEYHPCINRLAESILVADVTMERSELAAMKFLLSAGCRVKPGEDALLRGTHLLQTIRMLYHIYLTTESETNRTTSRAALQQLVTGIFVRLVRAQVTMNMTTNKNITPVSPSKSASNGDTHTNSNGDVSIFPSENHRDAFLVLRSICKLSMRNMPDPMMHSHVGLQTSGSNPLWDGDRDGTESAESPGPAITEAPRPKGGQPNLLYTGAIHPAMESKVLALELLHYVLENVKFNREFVLQSGSQFHSAIRNYLCVSLLKNCTSDNSRVVHLSLRMFALLVRNFRSILKNEVEAFVTNVFFVILDSKNSPIEHKSLVVTLFEEICSDPNTLAEIFLNYDCDLSAVDLFHRIVNTLSRVARSDGQESKNGTTIGLVAGAGAARAEKMRNEHRELRLDAMRALRQVLASLHASIVEPMGNRSSTNQDALENAIDKFPPDEISSLGSIGDDSGSASGVPVRRESGKQSLVEIYDSKKKRRQEESEAVLRFNQKPSAGIKYAAECGHLDADEPADIARYLLVNKDRFEKTQIGEYLGREAEYQGGIALKVLHEYLRLMDFAGLQFDDGIRYYLSGFRLPGEAQKASVCRSFRLSYALAA
jgi:Guanine nucleotide exchange factor in Golgi transport N-terminal/Sec7 domain